jgi:hypothetical protein
MSSMSRSTAPNRRWFASLLHPFSQWLGDFVKTRDERTFERAMIGRPLLDEEAICP